MPLPSPGDLPDPGIKPTSLTFLALAGWFFTTGTTWEAPKSGKSCANWIEFITLVSTQICLTLELMPLNIKQKPVLKET